MKIKNCFCPIGKSVMWNFSRAFKSMDFNLRREWPLAVSGDLLNGVSTCKFRS